MVIRNLPDGWTWRTVEDLSKNIQYGYTESANDEPIGPKFLRITDIQNGKVNWDTVPYCLCSDDDAGKYLLESGDIVFARTGATTGKSFLITSPPKAVFASYLIRLRLQQEVNKKYFSYFLDSPDYWSQIMQVRKGSAQPGVNAAILAKLKVPIAPLPEQERIVAKIEELFTQLDAGTSALERVQVGLRRYKASVLKAAVNGRLVIGNLELGEDELPEEWRWTTVGEIGKISGGLTKNSKRDSLKKKMPYLRVANVYANELQLDDVSEIGVEEKEINRALLQDGDLLVVEGNGSPDQIGRVAIWNGSISPCLHQNHIIKVRFEPKEVAEYVLYWLLSEGGREQITKVASSTSGLYTLSLSKVSSLPVPLPPLEEQRRIVAEVERRLSVAREVETIVEKALARASRLRQAVLKSAFEGRL